MDDDKAEILKKGGSSLLTFKKEDGLYVYYRKSVLHAANESRSAGFSLKKREHSITSHMKSDDNSKTAPASLTGARKPQHTQRETRSSTAVVAKSSDQNAHLNEECHLLTDSIDDHTYQITDLTKDTDNALTHRRFGHQSIFPVSDPCTVCLTTRSKRRGISKQPYKSTDKPLATIVADLIGPISSKIDGSTERTPSLGGAIYILTVMDEATHYVWTSLLKRKNEAAGEMQRIMRQAMTEFSGNTITRLHTDGGTEFVNSELKQFLDANGIQHTYTTRDKPQHNGKAERMNQTLILLVRSMLAECSAPTQLWGEAVVLATQIYNITPLRVLNHDTPHQRLTGQQPDQSKIRVFGCNAFYALPDTIRSKFQPTYAKGVWVGYSKQQNAYRILVDGNTIVTTRDVRLIETSYSHMSALSGDRADFRFDQDYMSTDSIPIHATTAMEIPEDASIDDDETPTQAVMSDPIPAAAPDMEFSSDEVVSDDDDDNVSDDEAADHIVDLPTNGTVRTRTASGREVIPVSYYGKPSVNDYGSASQRQMILTLTSEDDVPTTYKQAINHPDSDKWKHSMDLEISSMSALDVYELVPRTSDMNVISSRWLFKIKRDANNLPTIYKARLVAKGFQQKHGIDYDETYAPVAKYKSIKMLLSLTAQLGLMIHQIDYKTAFLNATLTEVIYMAQPDGYETSASHVWRLKKAIYGLKQSPREWNAEIDSTLNELGYTSTISDPCIYYR